MNEKTHTHSWETWVEILRLSLSSNVAFGKIYLSYWALISSCLNEVLGSINSKVLFSLSALRFCKREQLQESYYHDV